MELLWTGDNCAYLPDVLCWYLYALRASRERLGAFSEAEWWSSLWMLAFWIGGLTFYRENLYPHKHSLSEEKNSYNQVLSDSNNNIITWVRLTQNKASIKQCFLYRPYESSGGGKRTTTKLDARLWDIDSGKILIGGRDVSTIEPEILLKKTMSSFLKTYCFSMPPLPTISHRQARCHR